MHLKLGTIKSESLISINPIDIPREIRENEKIKIHFHL